MPDRVLSHFPPFADYPAASGSWPRTFCPTCYCSGSTDVAATLGGSELVNVTPESVQTTLPLDPSDRNVPLLLCNDPAYADAAHIFPPHSAEPSTYYHLDSSLRRFSPNLGRYSHASRKPGISGPLPCSNDRQEQRTQPHAYVRSSFVHGCPKARLCEHRDFCRENCDGDVDQQRESGQTCEQADDHQRAAHDLHNTD